MLKETLALSKILVWKIKRRSKAVNNGKWKERALVWTNMVTTAMLVL
jgi:hypothetical protein